MTRAFAPDPIPRSQLDQLLDLARRGPSAGNTQATRFVVLDRRELVDRYWDVTLPPPKRAGFRWRQLLDAPVLVLVTTDPGHYLARYSEPDKAATGRGDSTDRWPIPYWFMDAGAVVQNLLLALTEAGLGACLFGPFDHEDAVKRGFDLEPSTRIVATGAIGRPLPGSAGRSADRRRPPLDEVVHRPGPPDGATP